MKGKKKKFKEIGPPEFYLSILFKDASPEPSFWVRKIKNNFMPTTHGLPVSFISFHFSSFLPTN